MFDDVAVTQASFRRVIEASDVRWHKPHRQRHRRHTHIPSCETKPISDPIKQLIAPIMNGVDEQCIYC